MAAAIAICGRIVSVRGDSARTKLISIVNSDNEPTAPLHRKDQSQVVAVVDGSLGHPALLRMFNSNLRLFERLVGLGPADPLPRSPSAPIRELAVLDVNLNVQSVCFGEDVVGHGRGVAWRHSVGKTKVNC